MSVARALGVLSPGLLLLAVLWLLVLLRPRGRRPDVGEAQRAHDTAVLDAQEAAEGVAARQAEAAKRNALFHP